MQCKHCFRNKQQCNHVLKQLYCTYAPRASRESCRWNWNSECNCLQGIRNFRQCPLAQEIRCFYETERKLYATAIRRFLICSVQTPSDFLREYSMKSLYPTVVQSTALFSGNREPTKESLLQYLQTLHTLISKQKGNHSRSVFLFYKAPPSYPADVSQCFTA